LALDSTFAPALLWEGLCEWYITLGSPRLDSLLARLEGMRGRLTRNGQLRLSWLQAVSALDWQRADAPLRQLVTATGGTYLDLREHANNALRLNRPREAIRILERIDLSAQGWDSLSTADYWSLLAKCQHVLGDYEAELRSYRRGLATGTRDYQLEFAGIRALAALGHFAELQQTLDEAVSRASGPHWIGWYYFQAGTELMYHVNRDSGLAVLRRGIANLRTRRVTRADLLDADVRGVLAYLVYYTGDWGGCAREWGTIRRPRSIQELPCPGWILAARRGDRALASRLLAANDSTLRGAGAQELVWATSAHARVAALLGDRETAMSYLRQAMAHLAFDMEGIVLHTDIDFDSLRDYPPFVEFLRPKG